MSMFVVKRNGMKQPVQFDKITARIVKLCYGLNTDFVDPILVAQKVTAGTSFFLQRYLLCFIASSGLSAAESAL